MQFAVKLHAQPIGNIMQLAVNDAQPAVTNWQHYAARSILWFALWCRPNKTHERLIIYHFNVYLIMFLLHRII